MPNKKVNDQMNEKQSKIKSIARDNVNWNDVSSLGIGTSGLLLAEIVINNFATYLLQDIYLNIIPVVIFMGISLGNLIFHARKLSNLSPYQWALISSVLSAFSVGAFCFEPKLGLLWATIPFMGYGAYLSSCYAQLNLKSLVIGFGVGGLALYLIMGVFFQWIAPYLALIAILLPIGNAAFKFEKKMWALCALTATIAVILQMRGFYEPKLLTESLLEGFKASSKAMSPIYTPLIRTDLFHTEDDRYIIVTNGRRFAVVASAERVEHRKQSSFIPSYDVPYLVKKPKRVLVIGSAEGNNIISALKFNADSVIALDINPAVSEIMTHQLRDFSGGIYTDPKVKIVVDEGRHFVETTAEKFDLITLQGVQTGSHSNFINMSLLESHLLTKESLLTLWGRMTEDGCLWIEEYRWSVQNGGRQSTLVQSVLQMAKAELSLPSFDRQSLFVNYRQSKNNPNGANRKVREGLLLCKKEISLDEETRAIFAENEVSVLPTEQISSSLKFPIIDEHPYFVVNSDLILWFLKGCQVILLGILAFAGFSIFSKINTTGSHTLTASEYSWSLFLIGAGFILLISAAIGPLSLYLGDPQLSTPVLFVSMYAFGIIGGLLGLKVSELFSKWSLLFLAIYIYAVPYILEAAKTQILGLQNTVLRVLIFVLLIAPIGVCAELPYIWLLRHFEGKERSKAYTIENLGTLLGVPFAIYIQLQYGFYATMKGAAVFYVLAFLFLITSQFFKSMKIKLAILCLVIVSVGLQTIKLIEPSHFEARSTEKLDRSLDCRTEPPNKEIEVSFANAARLEAQKQIEVLIGPQDGCFVVGQKIPLYSIKREKPSRKIIKRLRRALVRVQSVTETTFEDLSAQQREYVVQKFGPKEGHAVFNKVGLNFLKSLPADE